MNNNHISNVRITLIGNLGKDPEMRSFASGDNLASFSIATSESWKNKVTGQPQESTTWHNISAFDDINSSLASLTMNSLSKGQGVFVEGYLRTTSTEDQNGNKRYFTNIIAEKIIPMEGAASRSFNQATILGEVNRDPVLRDMSPTSQVCNINLMTVRTGIKASTNELIDFKEFVTISLKDRGNYKLAKNSADLCRKGATINVVGKLVTRSWEADGVKKYSTEVAADDFSIVKRSDADAEQPQDNAKQHNAQTIMQTQASTQNGFYTPSGQTTPKPVSTAPAMSYGSWDL